jgi:Rrf2 family protein
LAAQKEKRPVASRTIAKARGVPERFLLKVLKPLVSARVLHSIKGPNGGYCLAKSPSEIVLLDVVEAVDGPFQNQSFNREETDGGLNQRLDGICDHAAEQVRELLQTIQISYLASKDTSGGSAELKSELSRPKF